MEEEATAPVLGEGQLGTPIPMRGRQNKFMQTDVIMKELLQFVNTSDAQSQTEPFISNPPRPFLKTAKTGLDMATQVLPEEVSTWKKILCSHFNLNLLLFLYYVPAISLHSSIWLGFWTERLYQLWNSH